MIHRLRVLQSCPEPRPTTNPYVVMLLEALAGRPEISLSTFTWKRALLSRYDVFHVHWPEILLSGRGRTRTAVRRVLFLLLVVRLRVTNTPLVRTAHNLRPHSAPSRVDAWLLQRADRRTSLIITLNEQTPVQAGRPHVTILHGHYRDWFAAHARTERQPYRAAFVGLIRPYKNVETAIRVFGQLEEREPQASLQVAGQPASSQLGDALEAAAKGLQRVSLRLEFLTDHDLVDVVTRADLVVLPYREMHNSGAALMALSLDRPVLVPDNDVTAQLAAEVGQEWVIRYPGDLTPARLMSALEAARRLSLDTRPDLGKRDWTRAGAEHLEAYQRALELTRRSARRRA
jgi:glycosyltransferase involved in cell wall biosynthesis